MTDNEKVLQVYADCIEYNGKPDWAFISLEVKKRYGIDKSRNACRKTINRIKSKATPTKVENKLVKLEQKEGGTQISERRILMSETDMKSVDFVMKAHGYDPLLWEVVNCVSNMWDSNAGEGNIINLYQSKLTVKPRTDKSQLNQADILELVKLINAHEIKHNFKTIKLKEGSKDALEVDFADLHIGSLSWHEETGENNDYSIAFGNLKRVVAQIRKELETGKYEKLFLVNLGDFVHADTINGETAHNTQLDTDSRPLKMVIKSYEAVMYIIDQLAIIDTDIISVPGNHSILVEFTIFYGMKFIYSKCEHIKFNISVKTRTAFLYGKNLIGLLHGNDIGKDEQSTWLQEEYREWWSIATYAEIHSGHFHKELSTNEKGGITQRTNPALKVIDKYEYDHGWKSKKAVLGYVWNKEEHLKEIFYFK